MTQKNLDAGAPTPPDAKRDLRRASFIGLVCTSTAWAIIPLYWRGLAAVSSFEVVCHRSFWSFWFMLAFVIIIGRFRDAMRIVSWRALGILLLTGSSMLVNWFLYVYAVNSNRVMETSLAYYITPLLSMMLGIIFFKDRPNRLQIVSIFVMLFGVGCQAVALGGVPLLAVGMGLLTAIYGALRKLADIDAISGMFWETALMAVPTGIMLVVLWGEGTLSLGRGPLWQDAMLFGSAVLTVVPMLFFTFSMLHLSLMTVGLVQYIAPSGAFLLSIFVFKEQFTTWHFISFCFIWLAIALYTLGAFRTLRDLRAAAAPGNARTPE